MNIYDEALLHGISHAFLASGIVEFVVREFHTTPRHAAVDELLRSEVFRWVWAQPEHDAPGPWAREGDESHHDSHAHILECRFNPHRRIRGRGGEIFPGRKKKEAVIKAQVRNAVEYLREHTRQHSASVMGHAIRFMRSRFSDGNFVDRTFLENYGIAEDDELYNRRDFTDWFDEECPTHPNPECGVAKSE